MTKPPKNDPAALDALLGERRTIGRSTSCSA